MQREEISIIVTSAGTASAISVIKALKSQKELKVKIIAVDADSMAAGLFLADESEIVPSATDPEYVSTLINLAERKRAKILIPIYSKEIKLISENSELLRKHGLLTLLAPVESIDVVNDKREMHNRVIKLGINAPQLYSKQTLQNLNASLLPLFAKPNTGSSSTGALKVTSLPQLKELVLGTDDLIYQEFIDAQEVTVDVLCDESNKALVIAPRLRLATKSGQSVKGKTISSEIFIQPVQKICTALNIKGVCNFQFFLKNNELIFIELNPRFAAGGLMLTVGAGANIPLLLLKLILHMNIDASECKTEPDVKMTRYWQEIILNKLSK